MTDIYDQATAHEEHDRELCLKMHINRTQESKLKSNGYCYNCDETVPDGETFCNMNCHIDYEKRLKFEMGLFYRGTN